MDRLLVFICCRTAEGRKCRLGEGGFGVVYKAVMNGVDEVAVKLVKVRWAGIRRCCVVGVTGSQSVSATTRRSTVGDTDATGTHHSLTKWLTQLLLPLLLLLLQADSPSRKELELFLKEVQTLAKLHHRNIVQFYGACLETGSMFFVTELMKVSRLEKGTVVQQRYSELQRVRQQRAVAAERCRWVKCAGLVSACKVGGARQRA
jgi:serine/threonine protein kinase